MEGWEQLLYCPRKCAFEVLIDDYKLQDPILKQLAQIVHAAGIEGELHTAPESSGLLAIALGFCETTTDDHEKLRLQFPIYDALYAYLKRGKGRKVGI